MTSKLMKFISENDGSPMSAVAAIMVKALNRALPKNQLPFRVETNHNYRNEVGCLKTHHDLLGENGISTIWIESITQKVVQRYQRNLL